MKKSILACLLVLYLACSLCQESGKLKSKKLRELAA